MSSPVGLTEVVFDFVPTAYVMSVKERVNVKDTEEKIKELMKAATLFEQQVILQDLLMAKRAVLAAELYVTLSTETQKDFLLHLQSVKLIFINFCSALSANAIFHESIEEKEKGSSGLTAEQLKNEKDWAMKLDKFAK